jgi:hypothetical protein
MIRDRAGQLWLDHVGALTVAARMRTHDCQSVSVMFEH